MKRVNGKSYRGITFALDALNNENGSYINWQKLDCAKLCKSARKWLVTLVNLSSHLTCIAGG